MPTTPHLNATDTTYMSPTNEEFCRINNADEDNQNDIFATMNSRLFILLNNYKFTIRSKIFESTV